MLKLLDIAGIFSGPGPTGEFRGRMEFGLKLIFWPLALLAVVALLLQLGVWRRDYTIAGPFPPEVDSTRHSFIVAVPEGKRPKWWMEKLVGDDNDHPFQSVLQLRIAGRNMGPAHTTHETIRQGKTRAFSHWGNAVIFPLPPGVKNGPETIASLRYNVRPPPWVTFVLTALSAILGWRLYEQTLRSLARRYAERPIAAALAAPYVILFGLCCVAILGSAAYLLTSLIALAQGWALPTTAIIRWSPIAQWAVRNEPYLGYLLLTLAGFGAAATWLAGLKEKHRRSVESYEASLQRVLVWGGFPIVSAAFILCVSAMWTGILRAGDPNSPNIGGLIPFSDAANYLTAAFDQVRDGVWNTVSLRRPVAAAFRSDLLFLANYSLQAMLILQACMVAAAACFATHSVMVWRGTWAGIGFFALTYIYSRYFVPTTLTEPLGLFWALLSIPFFIDAFVSGSVRSGLIAFAITGVALMTRMGSMFTIPALMLWLVWQFGRGVAPRLRILAVSSAILVGILGLNSLLKNLYGDIPGSMTGNLAYGFCGLSMGTGWQGCLSQLGSISSEQARIDALYSIAWQNIQARPEIMLGRLAENVAEFATRFPDVLWRGYGVAITEPDWLPRDALTAVCLIGLLYLGVRRARAMEFTFWLLLWASLAASYSIFYSEDGARTLAASLPLIVLFFAMGLTSPVLASNKQLPHRRWLRYGTAAMLTTAVLFVGGPWLAQRLAPVDIFQQGAQVKEPDQILVFGGRRISGFLVIADDEPLRNDVASLHLSDFTTIFGQSNNAFYQDLLVPVVPPLPFGFVFAPRIDSGESRYQYIVPLEVMERKDVPAWRFSVERWGYKPGGYNEYWFRVTKAEPIR